MQDILVMGVKQNQRSNSMLSMASLFLFQFTLSKERSMSEVEIFNLNQIRGKIF